MPAHHVLYAIAILAFAIVNMSVSSAVPAPLSPDKVAIFYHIYNENNTLTKALVDEQLTFLGQSGILSIAKSLHYGVVQPNLKNKPIDISANYFSIANSPSLTSTFLEFHKIGSWSSGHEMKTLSKLYSFCSANADYKVLYLHTKGAMGNFLHQYHMRVVLHAYTIHLGCLKALDNFDTCGWRLSPMPFPHYSGDWLEVQDCCLPIACIALH